MPCHRGSVAQRCASSSAAVVLASAMVVTVSSVVRSANLPAAREREWHWVSCLGCGPPSRRWVELSNAAGQPAAVAGISDVRAVNRARWGALAAMVRRAAQELWHRH
ncbi:hypothetical protein Sliba_19480 [Streptomyces nigrescens]|uniref:Uncharacterized protein n=1 Tax=Streptomyces nigrescens TaxID=1920 RepID=A0A640TI79_STRNI|nr:hypothetical protein Sliba_19480 [Streptomyces libani subsp. libani]GGW02051.1 hypothetical protein GCM10010500_58530 [Streptomyces libani subsp. libani]